MTDALDITSNQRFEIDGVPFVTGYVAKPSEKAFTIIKTPEMVERLRQVLERFERPRIVELGIAHGASVALISLLADPAAYLAVELNDQEIPLLREFLAERGLEDRVKTRFGVDQSDRAVLVDLVDETFGGEPLDVVFDDASHIYRPTRASFEVLFPRLRPGGLYLIEDWDWENKLLYFLKRDLVDPTAEGHEAAKELVQRYANTSTEGNVPLCRLALELVMAQAGSDGFITEVIINEQWIVVERGPAEIDPATFDLEDLLIDQYGQLSNPPADKHRI